MVPDERHPLLLFNLGEGSGLMNSRGFNSLDTITHEHQDHQNTRTPERRTSDRQRVLGEVGDCRGQQSGNLLAWFGV